MNSRKKNFTIIAITSQILAGLTFIFSGFVKAVDPLGSTNKFIDYFHAFNMTWLEPTAFPLSIVLSGSEFLIGVCLLLFIQNRWAAWGGFIVHGIFHSSYPVAGVYQPCSRLRLFWRCHYPYQLADIL